MWNRDMSWLIPALLSPIFFATVNHIDKHLLSKYFKGGGAGSLVIFSSFIGIPVAILILLLGTPILSISTRDIGLLIICGMLYMAAILPYFYAMMRDDASVVAPLYQLVSPMGYILGVLFLGEHVAGGGLLGGSFVFIGAVILSLEFSKRKKIQIKKDVFFLMLLSSFLFAVNGAIFKIAALDTTSFLVSAFWDYIGVVIFGIIVFLNVPIYRKQFLKVLQKNSSTVLGLNAVNEVCAVIAQLLLHFASLLAPLAIVFWVVEGFQPFFVLLIGVLLSLFFPRLTTEKLSRHNIIQKGTAVGLMLVGTYLLSSL